MGVLRWAAGTKKSLSIRVESAYRRRDQARDGDGSRGASQGGNGGNFNVDGAARDGVSGPGKEQPKKDGSPDAPTIDRRPTSEEEKRPQKAEGKKDADEQPTTSGDGEDGKAKKPRPPRPPPPDPQGQTRTSDPASSTASISSSSSSSSPASSLMTTDLAPGPTDLPAPRPLTAPEATPSPPAEQPATTSSSSAPSSASSSRPPEATSSASQPAQTTPTVAQSPAAVAVTLPSGAFSALSQPSPSLAQVLAPSPSASPPVAPGAMKPSRSPSSSMPPGLIAGIAVGSIAAVSVLVALLFLFRRLRKRGSAPALGDSGERPGGDFLDPEMKDSLVSDAAPIAGRLDEERGTGAAIDQPDSSPNSAARLAAGARRSLGGVFRRSRPGREDPEEDPGGSPSPAAGAAGAAGDPAQQAHPAPPPPAASCPVQKLQNRLRLHNSTDPRPRPGAPRPPVDRDRDRDRDRGSVSSVSSCGSRCSSRGSSSGGAPRFSFGLLLQPSLDLFRFRDVRTSAGGRGSGWSLWFRQDDGGRQRPGGLASKEKSSAS